MEIKRKYGLIGESLSHSFSQKYFTQKFDNQRINSVYMNFEIKSIEALKEVFQLPDIFGLNVTIPYKEKVIPFLDKLTEGAKEMGAVNTIQFKNGIRIGHNTDAFGFKQMIKPFFRAHHERALVLGTGGASKAIAFVLEELGCTLCYVSRNPKGSNQFRYSDVNENMLRFCKLLVNTTPLGTYPDFDTFPDIPYHYLSPKHLVIDLVYNPPKTKFLKKAEHQGAVVLNGRTMLEQQAEKAWQIWNE